VNAAKKMIDIWLESEFGGGRSLPKVAMIKAMDEKRKE
jgi:ribose 5-phosphate isomerase B